MKWNGLPVSAGYGIAKVFQYDKEKIQIIEEKAEDPYVELIRFHQALDKADSELDSLMNGFAEENKNEAKIFQAHKEFLRDDELLQEVENVLINEKKTADYVVDRVYEEFACLLEAAADELIAARSADIRDVKYRILRILAGKKEKNLSEFQDDVIIVAKDLTPSDTASLDRIHVKGIVTEQGGATSHTAILAKSLRIPAVVGASGICNAEEGKLLYLDAVQGVMIKNPSQDEIIRFEKEYLAYKKKQQITAQYSSRECITKDGAKIKLGINIGSCEWNDNNQNYDYIGLFRTEFLYMESDHLPTEEEQFLAYKKVLEQAGEKAVTLRTLDIGGDKNLSYMTFPKEDNPFLGRRAVRLCFDEPELFLTQLRAALRASCFGSLQLMFPMISCPDDIKKAFSFVEKAKDQLRLKGQKFDEHIKLGVMIEIPSAAIVADQIAEMVDFASVGSNDLCQYLCAADRMNPMVSSSYQSLSPAMLRIFEMISNAFNDLGKPLSICGESGGNPFSALALTGLGYKSLSMNEACLSEVKEVFSKVTTNDLNELGQKLKYLHSEAEVEDKIRTFLIHR